MNMPVKSADFETLDAREFIIIKGAEVNNLQKLDVALPRNKMIVITGVSGSGKSSLAFDTLFAEGQRMYVESLSAYTRQFLGRMEKPEVEYIRGVSPAIAVEQKVNTRNSRSTVGTSTEIYDYLKLLFARIGKTYHPETGELVQKDSVSSVVDYLFSAPAETRYLLLAPLVLGEDRSMEEELQLRLQQGFTRVRVEGEVRFIEQLLEENPSKKLPREGVEILIDRAVIRHESEDEKFRAADSTQTAFFEGHGTCIAELYAKGEKQAKQKIFSDRFEADGVTFEEPSVSFFSFNNPHGACRRCDGYGTVLGIDERLVFPDEELSVYEGAIAPWKGEKMSEWAKPLINRGIEFDFPIHRAYKDLSEAQKKLLWEGNEYFSGLNDFFEFLKTKSHKIQYRVMLSRYRGRRTCPDCRGTRIRKDAGYVKVGGKSIQDLVLMPIDQLHRFFEALEVEPHEEKIARRLLIEVRNRLGYLLEVGLPYLNLNRRSSTLSGGEFQRIKLATSLGSALVGSMYILDEPSIGLHPRDTQNLIRVLHRLRDLGNTVIVVEHEEEVMLAADQILDIGPDAGVLGGNLMFQGTPKDLLDGKAKTHTGDYLSGELQIKVPESPRKSKDFIHLRGAAEHNLKNIDVSFPLGTLTAVTGVSGSGKSTLVRKLLYPALRRQLGDHNEEVGQLKGIEGFLKGINHVEMIDQNPIGKSSRSNPVTYIKAYDVIREIFANQPLSKQRGYKAKHFSFNVTAGRCEACQGEGVIKVEMQFMADLYLTCEECHGRRFQEDILEVMYKGKNIYDVLQLTVDEAIEFFSEEKKLINRLKPLQEVGLGYIGLGQSSNTLSGGEAQRVKLAFYLAKGNKDGHILFIFDEPTTGLHFHDIQKLLKAINALVDFGHTAVVIEHNVEVIKTADWVIDLGPEGGEGGGNLCFAGTPRDLAAEKDNLTGQFLKGKF